MFGLSATEHATAFTKKRFELLRFGHRSEFTTGEGFPLNVRRRLEDANFGANRLRGKLVVAGDDDNANTGSVTRLNGSSDFRSRGISQTSHANED